MPDRECRVYGNQYGTWVEFSGGLAEDIAVACNALGITPQEYITRALAHYVGPGTYMEAETPHESEE